MTLLLQFLLSSYYYSLLFFDQDYMIVTKTPNHLTNMNWIKWQFSFILSVTHFLTIMNAIGSRRNCSRVYNSLQSFETSKSRTIFDRSGSQKQHSKEWSIKCPWSSGRHPNFCEPVHIARATEFAYSVAYAIPRYIGALIMWSFCRCATHDGNELHQGE
jgi:hypothetical protein